MQNFILSRNEALDSVQHAKENSQAEYLQTIRDIIIRKPFGDRKFYIFQFWKRVDDGSGVKVMYHQPRLTKPEPLPGTTLLKVDTRDPDTVTVLWTLPNQENFGLYQVGKMFSDPFVHECIQKYLKNPMKMCQPDPDDPTDDQARYIYKEAIQKMKKESATQRKNVADS